MGTRLLRRRASVPPPGSVAILCPVPVPCLRPTPTCCAWPTTSAAATSETSLSQIFTICHILSCLNHQLKAQAVTCHTSLLPSPSNAAFAYSKYPMLGIIDCQSTGEFSLDCNSKAQHCQHSSILQFYMFSSAQCLTV